MNPAGELSVERGTRTAVTLATLPDDGLSGSFFYVGKTLPLVTHSGGEGVHHIAINRGWLDDFRAAPR